MSRYFASVDRLTGQPPTINEGLKPFRSFNVEQIKKHVENDFLWENESAVAIGSIMPNWITLVVRDGIRKVSMIERMANISSIQKYIRP